MSSKSLYSTYEIDAFPTKALATTRKTALSRMMKKLPEDDRHSMLGLILVYAMEWDDFHDGDDFPYGLIISDGSATVDIDKLPNRLKYILERFAKNSLGK